MIADLSRWVLAQFPNARDLTRDELSRYEAKHPIHGWVVPFQYQADRFDLQVVLLQDFPWEKPRVYCTEKFQFMQFPHVEKDGAFCLYPPGTEHNPFNPKGLIWDAIKEATRLIVASYDDAFISDFADEFDSYWSKTDGGKNIVSLLSPGGPSRRVSLWCSTGDYYLADERPRRRGALCVMVLMLQSGNRQNKEALRMFRDRGDVHNFFPADGEQLAHKAALEATPNLDGYNDIFPMVKDSLGNALRLIRPIVVMDEGQKATSDLAHETLYGFNPIFVLELTATPKDVAEKRPPNPREARYANLLVEVTGRELHDEDMIKMPLNLDPRQGTDWRATLTASVAKLDTLHAAAATFRADTG